jgi:hypothetical protein
VSVKAVGLSSEIISIVEAFLVTPWGSNTEVPENGKALRLDRSLRAGRRHTGVPWELVRTKDVLRTNTGEGEPVEQHPSDGAEISPPGE